MTTFEGGAGKKWIKANETMANTPPIVANTFSSCQRLNSIRTPRNSVPIENHRLRSVLFFCGEFRHIVTKIATQASSVCYWPHVYLELKRQSVLPVCCRKSVRWLLSSGEGNETARFYQCGCWVDSRLADRRALATTGEAGNWISQLSVVTGAGSIHGCMATWSWRDRVQ